MSRIIEQAQRSEQNIARVRQALASLSAVTRLPRSGVERAR
jgi:hypothetical protein